MQVVRWRRRVVGLVGKRWGASERLKSGTTIFVFGELFWMAEKCRDVLGVMVRKFT